ncbi:hypothetical protein MBLNU230_g1006t1 [Neophaeotheca triangularis]
MGDFLTAIKSVSVDTSSNREELLTSVETRNSKKPQEEAPSPERESQNEDISPSLRFATTPTEALQILRSEPDTDTLVSTFDTLNSPCKLDENFSLHATGPLQAQIIQAILTITIPSFWNARGSGVRAVIIPSLTNPTALNAILARLRSLSDSAQKHEDGSDAEALRTTLSAARHVLRGDSYVHTIQRNLAKSCMDPVKSSMAWKDFINVLGSGKVVSVIAQAEDAVKLKRSQNTLSSGSKYAGWLGRNISYLLQDETGEDESPDVRTRSAADLLAKAGRLGYPLHLVKALFSERVRMGLPSETTSFVQFCGRRNDRSNTMVDLLFGGLPRHAQAQILETVLRWLSEILPNVSGGHGAESSADIAGVAGFLSKFVNDNQERSQLLARHLEDPVLSSMLSQSIRRATAKTLCGIPLFDLQALLEKVMGTFNDQLFIKHASLAQQDAMARNLLLLAGYVHRANPVALLMVARSSGHMQGVSNRLDTSSQRARWLGMIVATAISSLVDRQGSKMSFGTEDMQTEEAEKYLQFVNTADDLGGIHDFANLLDRHRRAQKRRHDYKKPAKPDKLPVLDGKQSFGPPRPPELLQTEVEGEKVTEILDDEEEEEDQNDDSSDDLRPYAKPDSDPEDSDEDATLVNRNKSRPPVYIRDLMAMLRDDKDPDRFQLGIKHAPSLIRRKSNFGREVKDHAEELASILCNLQDPFSTEDFDELRLQGLIAVLLSDVTALGPWLSNQAFTGDYSISQRCLILSSLGLGGRELAGFDQDETLNPSQPNTSLPSKRLPNHLHNLYTTNTQSSSVKNLDAPTQTLSNQLMQPLALSAADKTTSHLNPLKIRTFSSRLTPNNRTQRKTPQNALAKLFSQTFFSPLLAKYHQEATYHAHHSVYITNPTALTTFLKTLALLLHASGPATTNLHDIIDDFWALLLSLRVTATGDKSIMESVLFSLLTLLEVRIAAAGSDISSLVEKHGKVLHETREWVGVVFQGLEGSGAREEEAKVRSLAAGVLVRVQEVFEVYREGMIGGLGV